MRHRQRTKTFGRKVAARKALFQGLVAAMVEHEQIKTTLPKAKELRRYLEPLVTMAATDSVHNRRRAIVRMRNKKLLDKLFLQLGPRYRDRPGGYVRIVRAGYRAGDKAPMALVQFVHVADELAEAVSQAEATGDAA